MREVVLTVACDTCDIESLDEVESLLAVAIHHVIYSALVVLLEHSHVQYVLANEYLVGHLDDLVFSVLIEDDDIVDVGTVAYVFILFQPCADESLLTVDIQLLVSLNDGGCLDGVEVAYLGAARMFMSILVAQELEPVGSNLHHIGQVAVNLLYLLLNARHEFVGLVLIKLQYALHLDFEELEDVVLGHLAHKLRIIRREPLVDMLAYRINVRGLFKLAVLIDAFLDENFLERRKVKLLEQFALTYLQFLPQEVLGVVNRMSEHVADSEELRLVGLDDAAVGRDVHLAVREGI